MEAVGRELIRRDITPHLAGRRRVAQQVADEGAEVFLRRGDVLALMQERGQLAAMEPLQYDTSDGMLMVFLDGFSAKAPARFAALVADLR